MPTGAHLEKSRATLPVSIERLVPYPSRQQEIAMTTGFHTANALYRDRNRPAGRLNVGVSSTQPPRADRQSVYSTTFGALTLSNALPSNLHAGSRLSRRPISPVVPS